MLKIDDKLSIPLEDIEWQAVRSQGAGGQNVNKVSSAIHLRYDVNAANLPDGVKSQLLALNDKRLSKEGVIVIKAQQHRRQEKNLESAFERLADMIREATRIPKTRKPTRPSRSSVRKRLEKKTRHSTLKARRGKVGFDD